MILLKEEDIDYEDKYVFYIKKFNIHYGYYSVVDIFPNIKNVVLGSCGDVDTYFELNVSFFEGDNILCGETLLTKIFDIYKFEDEEERERYNMLQELRK